MKAPLFFIILFFVNSLNSYSQISEETIIHYFQIEGEGVPNSSQYLFEVKDSSIIVLPFQHIDFFRNIKDPVRLNNALQNIKTGNSPIKLYELPISSVDQIVRTRRYKKGINTIIGLGVGLFVGGIYLATDPNTSEVNHGFRALGAIGIVGASTLIGVAIPVMQKKFYIGRNQKKFEILKRNLRAFTILQ